MKKKLLVILTVILFFMGAIILAEESSEDKDIREFGQDQDMERQDHQQGQKGENKVFRDSLKGKTSMQQSEDIESQRKTRDKDNIAFDARMLKQSKDFNGQQEVKKQERWQEQEDARIPSQSMDSLSNRFANETRLTDTEKKELITFFKDQYQKNIPYRDEMYSGNVAFFEQIVNNHNLTQEQKKAEITSHFEEQQSKMENY